MSCGSKVHLSSSCASPSSVVLGGVCVCRLADDQKGKCATAEKEGLGKMYQVMSCMGKKGAPFQCLFLRAFVPIFHGSPGKWVPPCSWEQGPVTCEGSKTWRQYVKGRKFDWVEREESRGACRSTANRAGEPWQDQVPDCSACEDAIAPPRDGVHARQSAQPCAV